MDRACPGNLQRWNSNIIFQLWRRSKMGPGIAGLLILIVYLSACQDRQQHAPLKQFPQHITTIDSFAVSILDSSSTPLSHLTLRQKPLKDLSEEAVQKMLREYQFYCSSPTSWQNPSGKGIRHQYQLKTNNQLVQDSATGLTWQRSGSENWMHHKEVRNYIRQLNQEKFAGYTDWRLPTLEEAMSLMETSPQEHQLFISSLFDPHQAWIWTSDRFNNLRTWAVYYNFGICVHNLMDRENECFVRAVR